MLPAFVFVCNLSAYGQQRPVLTEDPRLIPQGTLDVETGFAFEKRAVYRLSALEGTHLSLLPSGLHFGLGERAEFQLTGTVHDYLRTSDGGRYSDFGDISLSTKMKIVGESHNVPVIAFRPTVTLPNANQASGLGLNTTRFFASILAGKTIRRAFVFGNIGSGIMDNPTHAGVQDDVLTFGLAASVPMTNRMNWLGEFSGVKNPRDNPAPGSETRRQIRTGIQITAIGVRWDAGVMAGLTRVDPRYGIAFGMTKRFGK